MNMNNSVWVALITEKWDRYLADSDISENVHETMFHLMKIHKLLLDHLGQNI